MRSTPSPSRGGARSSTSSRAASAPSTTSCEELGVTQPQVSKHLRVLREVGAVEVREEGRRRLYSLNGRALKPIHDWVKTYERTWSERFELLDDVLDETEGDGMTATVTLPTEEQILITREFDAPRHLVYRAWTTPELVRRWWSGRRGEMQVAEIDLRVGGMWRYVMTAEGGFEVAFHGEYREIVENERIVTTEVFEAMPGDGVLDIVTFREEDGRTTLELLVECGSREIRDVILESGMEAGMQEQMDLLEELVTGPLA